MRFIYFVFVLVMTSLYCRTSYGQDLLDTDGNKVTPYYIDINTTEKTSVMDVRGEFLHIQYHDALGQAATIPFVLYNWKREVVTELNIKKEFGLNYFDVKFKDHGITLVENETYTCQLTDERGKKYSVYFKYLPPLKKVITLNIFVKPVYLQCDDPSGSNLTEFYGDIEGGKAPYKLNWYVMNKSRTEFLYQPTQVVLESQGYTSSIQVDKSPEYYVLLYVKDACGNEQTSTVQMMCEGNRKKFNTVFFNLQNNNPLQSGQLKN